MSDRPGHEERIDGRDSPTEGEPHGRESAVGGEALVGELRSWVSSLDGSVDSLTRHVLALEHHRAECAELARRHEQVATRLAGSPVATSSLVVAQLQLVTHLLRATEATLRRCTRSIEEAVGSGGRAADRLFDLGPRPPADGGHGG